MICPLCQTQNSEVSSVNFSGSKAKGILIECKKCGLCYLGDYLKDRKKIYDENYSVWGDVNEGEEKIVRESKINNFDYLLKNIKQAGKNKKLLDIGTGRGYLLEAARKQGFDCYGVELSEYTSKKALEKFPGKIFNGKLEESEYPDNFFDVITMTDVIEHITNPIGFFEEIKRILRKNGIILITTPNTSSVIRKIMAKNWFQYKEEHVIYWNRTSIEFLMRKIGFKVLKINNNKKKLTLKYYNDYFRKYPSGLGKMFTASHSALPKFLKKKSFLNPLTSEILVLARK